VGGQRWSVGPGPAGGCGREEGIDSPSRGSRGSGGQHKPAGGPIGKGGPVGTEATWRMVGVKVKDQHEVIGRSTAPRLAARRTGWVDCGQVSVQLAMW